MKIPVLGKCLLIIIMIATVISPLFFLRLNEQTFNLNLFKVLAKAGSLCGTILLIWQSLLGYRGITGKLFPDLIWILNVHKTIGRYALFLITLHPVFITFYYLRKKQFNPLLFEKGLPFDAYVLVGIIAFVIFLLIVITSVFFRTKMNFKNWYGIHITSYLAILLLFVHSIPIGQTLSGTQLGNLWWLLAFFVIAVFIWRLLNQLGIGAKTYSVSDARNVGLQATEITCDPVKGAIKPRIGQFVYFRTNRRQCGRPFTVSQVNSGRLSITVKALGHYSTSLQSIQPGQKAYIDGPYGIFLQDALKSDRPLIMIAGGIGITPFYRLLTESTDIKREMILFYGSKTVDEIVYHSELEKMEHVKVIHVISHQKDYLGEKGFITLEIIQKYADQNLTGYDFLLCGPPVMIKKLEKTLLKATISPERIHHELFSY